MIAVGCVVAIVALTVAVGTELQRGAGLSWVFSSATGEGGPSPAYIEALQQATYELESLPVKGRASKTGYTRDQFGSGWASVNGCSTRDIILHRDLRDTVIDDQCRIVSGSLADPYTGTTITFSRDAASQAVQIDHVVALSDAWQKGAQLLTATQRKALANDPLNLLAVDGAANQQKADGDAATWLPPNKAFRCEYVARQVAVKVKYALWVTDAEQGAMRQVLSTCR